MLSGLLPLLAPRTSTMLSHGCVFPDALCERSDLLLDFPDLHLRTVEKDRQGGLMLEVESSDPVTGCPGCGVVATGHGRVMGEVIDAPWAGRAVRIRRRKPRWGSAARRSARWSRSSSRTPPSACRGAC